jgi:UDP-N-acetylmuramyl pentapeptide phosphotransferase/UDP-N-acetylglucosamine-1-phosphate transferase
MGTEMVNLALSFVCSFTIVYFIVRSASVHGAFSLDGDLHGIQKNHAYAVPRVGGVGIACAALISVSVEWLWSDAPVEESLLLLLCAVPAFASGVVEDLTKRVSPRVRLICTLASALAGVVLIHAVVVRVDVPLVDQWLRFAPLAIGFTMLGSAGVSNAVNIIDGFNGLAAVVAMFIFASIGYVAYQVGDHFVMSMALTMLGALGGFVLWNFPTPAVFLGDGGAYLTGFLIAELLILLIGRHPNVSAWYAMVVAIYPTFETLFSIYRRRVSGRKAIGEPDRLHLHTLVYRRVVRKGSQASTPKQRTRRNSRTSIYLWVLNLLGVVPATFCWDIPAVLAITVLIFAAVYIGLYLSIVRFKTPRWLLGNGTTPVVAPSKVQQPRH